VLVYLHGNGSNIYEAAGALELYSGALGVKSRSRRPMGSADAPWQ
jgi:hypothetical protein